MNILKARFEIQRLIKTPKAKKSLFLTKYQISDQYFRNFSVKHTIILKDNPNVNVKFETGLVCIFYVISDF
jgi:hypothetical protein